MSESIYLRGAGTSLLIDVRDADPRIVHWGADLGSTAPDPAVFTPPVAHSMFDTPVLAGVVPQASRGWRGVPGVRGSRSGLAFAPRFALGSADATGSSAVLHLADPDVGLELDVSFSIEAGGLLLLSSVLRNTGDGVYDLESVRLVLPIPARAAEALDTAGRALREKRIQRRPIGQGTWLRSGRHGRTGHDSAALIAAGTAGFGNGFGEVWGVHFGWSGNHDAYVERVGGGQGVLGVGELLEAGEVRLAPGESYASPIAFAAYSAAGLDALSARFHTWMRARPSHPATPRPVVLNTWEAVYFNHDLDILSELAETAAAIGVERFVLDDGWFTGRRNDRAGLGDWFVDADVWPDGLGPLIEKVHGLGMQFGLWFEPEMINEESNVAREHPDWISGPGNRTSIEWRFQQVIDLTNPDAWTFVFDRLDALFTEYPIDAVKWDQNRDQLELGHEGRASTRAQTLAAYRLLDELRAKHPGIEIETCSSGGARVDFGILARTDRLWASDTNDALERQEIQRGTELIVPPELVGAHIGPTHSHSTGRTHDLSFRAATALFGHFGMEWDIREAVGDARDRLMRAIAFYKANRDLIATGRLVHGDDVDPATNVYGVVDAGATRAVFVWATVAFSQWEVPAPARFTGLDPDRVYRVALALDVEPGVIKDRVLPPWLADGAELTGRALAEIGLPMPILDPEHALVFTVDAR
jgi:alpha-galactosidase